MADKQPRPPAASAPSSPLRAPPPANEAEAAARAPARPKSKQVRIGPYLLKGTLGSGSFGKVKLAEDLLTQTPVALKMISRRAMAAAAAAEAETAAHGPLSETAARGGDAITVADRLRREISLLRVLRHDNIVRLYDVLLTQRSVVLIMEEAGRELFEHIVDSGSLPEPEARQVFQQLISAVAHMHLHHVVHRDLKPENVFIDTHSRVRIGDFGFSTMISDGDFLRTCCGSPNYAAPEVIAGRRYAGPEVDIWSLGVILYVLLTGMLPFDDPDIPALYQKVTSGQFHIPSSMPAQAAHLVQRMLTVDPTQRATMAEIMEDPWFSTDLPPGFNTEPHASSALSLAPAGVAQGQDPRYPWWSFSRTEADPRAEADAEVDAGDGPETAPPTPSVTATVPGGELLMATLTSLPLFPAGALQPAPMSSSRRLEPDLCIATKIANSLGVSVESILRRLQGTPRCSGEEISPPFGKERSSSVHYPITTSPHSRHYSEALPTPSSPLLSGVTDAELVTAYEIAADRHDGHHPAPDPTPHSPLTQTQTYPPSNAATPASALPPLPSNLSSLPPPLLHHQLRHQTMFATNDAPSSGSMSPHQSGPSALRSPYLPHSLRARSHTIMVAKPQAPPGHALAPLIVDLSRGGQRRSSHTGVRPNTAGPDGWVRDWNMRSDQSSQEGYLPSPLGTQPPFSPAPSSATRAVAAAADRRGSAPIDPETDTTETGPEKNKGIQPTSRRRSSLAPTAAAPSDTASRTRNPSASGSAQGAASSGLQSPALLAPLTLPPGSSLRAFAPGGSETEPESGGAPLALGSRTASVSGPGASPFLSPAVSPTRSRLASSSPTSPAPTGSGPASASASTSASASASVSASASASASTGLDRGNSQYRCDGSRTSSPMATERQSFSGASDWAGTYPLKSKWDEHEMMTSGSGWELDTSLDMPLSPVGEMSTGIAVLETSLPNAPAYSGRGGVGTADNPLSREQEFEGLDEAERAKRRREARKKREREQRATATHRRARWHFGIRSRSGPAAIIAQLYRSLAALGVEWHVSLVRTSEEASPPLTGRNHDGSMTSNEDAAGSLFSLETRWHVGGVGVRIDLQLYRVDWGQYLVDFRHVGYEVAGGMGAPKVVCSPYLYLECATQLIAELSG